MMARQSIIKLAWLCLIGPIVVYGFIYLHCLSKADSERQLSRRRMSVWIKSAYATPVGRTINSANTSSSLLKSLSPGNSGTIATRDLTPHVVRMVMITGASRGGERGDREGTVHNTPDKGDKNQDISNRTKGQRGFERDKKRLKWKIAGSGTVKEKVVNNKGIYENRRTDYDIDQKHKTNLGFDGVFDGDDNYLGDGEDEEIDDPNINADVKRAVPDLKVKRYVDEPIDPHTYPYIHNPVNQCNHEDGTRRNVFILFMVVTAPGHFKRREAIRETYGKEEEWPALKRGIFTTVFLLGNTFNDTLREMINLEAQTHKDIVQEDFVDSYANLSRKTVMGLKWTTKYCRHACYTMKIDDDSMINQGRFLWIFKNSTLYNWTASETLMGAPVLRNTSSKYFISREYYPAEKYPPYMNGPGYLMSTNLAEVTYKMALTTPLFPWEDVFVGTCLQKLGFRPVIHRRFLWIASPGFFSSSIERTLVTRLRSYVVISNMMPDEMKFMWNICKIKLVKPR